MKNTTDTTKKKKRLRVSAIIRNEDDTSRLQFEENYAVNYMKKLYQKLDENLFDEMLLIIQNFQTDDTDLKVEYKKMETILKDNVDLLDEFLGFLEPYQAFECGKLIEYYEIQNIKQFVRNLMSHFKRQPNLLKKIIDKLCYLAEHENVRHDIVEEAIAPFLQKNSTLMQQFLRLLPDAQPSDSYFSSDDFWEEFSVDNEVVDEETFEVSSSLNDTSNTTETNSCIYDCKKNTMTLCPICNVKFINGRIYVVDGKTLRPANLVFDPADQSENIRRLSSKNDYFTPVPTSTNLRSRTIKRTEVLHKELIEGRSSPFTVTTESEEEQGENESHKRKKRRKAPQKLKIRFNNEKVKPAENGADHMSVVAEDTAPSNDEGSCEIASKEGCDESVFVYSNTMTLCKEVVPLENMELNISATSFCDPNVAF